ncbi:MAG TPA: carboxypeptidase-like regulatory domain-containing protein [Thermoanaerobaculia bacterium]|nr:carboxypeptidase-like regulatory domain-containing protein [Thermoanaerobaculia bacterium]
MRDHASDRRPHRTAVAVLLALGLALAPLAPAAAQAPSLAGAVVKDSGHPLDQGTVELLAPGTEQVKHRAYTDSHGRFAFRAPAGSYDLRIKFGDRVLPQNVGGAARDRRPVTVTAQPQTLTVEVKTG